MVGELAVGSLPHRDRTLAALLALRRVSEAQLGYVLGYLDRLRPYGLGLSWGDVQLLAAADLSGVPIWTDDRRLRQQAEALGLAWTP